MLVPRTLWVLFRGGYRQPIALGSQAQGFQSSPARDIVIPHTHEVENFLEGLKVSLGIQIAQCR